MYDMKSVDITQNENDETFKINGDWAALSRQLKARFPLLTDTDLLFEAGKEEELLIRIRTRLSKKREEVIGIINKGLAEKA
jgi:hypothetical protein